MSKYNVRPGGMSDDSDFSGSDYEDDMNYDHSVSKRLLRSNFFFFIDG